MRVMGGRTFSPPRTRNFLALTRLGNLGVSNGVRWGRGTGGFDQDMYLYSKKIKTWVTREADVLISIHVAPYGFSLSSSVPEPVWFADPSSISLQHDVINTAEVADKNTFTVKSSMLLAVCGAVMHEFGALSCMLAV